MSMYAHLRDWLAQIDSWGELKRFHDVDWNLEMGGIADLAYRKARGVRPAVLFDRIKGYPGGYRALFNQLGCFPRHYQCPSCLWVERRFPFRFGHEP